MSAPSLQLDPNERVHVLGLGSIGTFMAYCLTDVPSRPCTTLMLHRPALYDAFKKNNEKISITTTKQTQEHGRFNAEGSNAEGFDAEGFDAEVLDNDGSWRRTTRQQSTTEQTNPHWENTTNEPIRQLVVATKTIHTVGALKPLQSRLTPETTILFMQNGMGIVEEVNRSLFTDPVSRPKYLLGVISHGVGRDAPFRITHTGFAAASVGPSSSRPEEQGSDYLLRTLPQSPLLNATAYSYEDVLQMQLEKLIVNSYCNPVCALHDSKNGILLGETHRKLKLELFAEVVQIIHRMPELQGVEGLKNRFGMERLEATVDGILEKTRNTTCSMVWDLRAKRETEIAFINGYWVKKGIELGVDTPVNNMLVHRIQEIQSSWRA
ncbi:uncharacterized protein K452DRAFT_291730 [Aplosporella prunicola CBS 121167]|uniref:2-dehydropantoate 2-reductase n=1 Tax=Aplosporella prunicola CBS 121167 TaxID=1176127 RepID=A0A6A6B3Q0_9PEZI|nr:uncharacterized protein K452DRAFT_291730 [Aplosporella prunicola CBS 121167]KAF2137351.1 hypothetical protein K452DRAFT_291730 [Aplosporella prunicola CBS 121167]